MSASRLTTLFATLAAQEKKAFIPYVTVGDPDVEFTRECVHALLRAGAHAIELGLPFSDPVADGPANLVSAERALKGGTTPDAVLELAKKLRADGVTAPLVLFTYLNPLMKRGFEPFLAKAKASGIDATLIVDLPPEESKEYVSVTTKLGLDPIFLASPTTPPARAKEICAASRGFVYYVSRAGVTGVQQSVSATLDDELRKLKAQTKTPVCVGFGISTPDQAKQAGRHADGVIVGSAFVRLLGDAAKDRAGTLADRKSVV